MPLCLIAFPFATIAQSGSVLSEKSLGLVSEYSIQYWTSEQGLPQNSVNDIIQDKNGFLWICTFNGLVRFDGGKFVIYNASNTKAMHGTGFLRFFLDSHGALWIIDNEGALLKQENGVFTSFKISAQLISAITESETGNIIVGTSQGGIYNFEKDAFKFLFKIPEGGITNLITDHENKLWIAGNGLLIYENDLSTRNDAPKFFAVENLKNTPVGFITKDKEENIWLTSDEGIFRMKGYSPVSFPLPLTTGNSVKRFIIEDENILAATDEGLVIASRYKSTIINTSQGLSSPFVKCVFIDSEKNIWVGTDRLGINKLKKKVFTTFSKEDGLIDNGVAPIIQLKDKSILIGNNCGGINRFVHSSFSRIFYEIKNTCVWSILEDKNNDIWAGTYGGGIYRQYANQIINYTTDDNLPSNIIFSLFEDRRGIIWIGTDAGICYFDNGTIHNFNPIENNKSHITFITEDSQGKIWYGSLNGIGIINRGTFKSYTTRDGLSSDHIRYIYEDADGVMWFGTAGGGLIRMKNNTFFSFNKTKPILDENVWCIAEDDFGYFWMSSNNGVYAVSRDELNNYADGKSVFLNPNYFTREDGIKNAEFNGGFQSPVLKSSAGQLWFSTIKGAARVNPSDFSFDAFVPSIFIEKMSVNKREVTSEDSLKEISQVAGSIEFEFTSPRFNNLSHTLFQTKLEGNDSDWSEPTLIRTASYVNLPPGNYTFKVRLYGNYNSGVNKQTSVSFRIPFPFYKTPLFYLLGILLLIGIVSATGYFRIRYIKRKEHEKTKINKQYAALELKALQAQMNPHFLFNCLNTIKYFITTDDNDAAGKYLGKFSKLMRMFLEHSKSNTVSLNDEIELLNLYIELERMRFEDGFNYVLSIADDLDTHSIIIPGMLFQPFVENAINHGLRNLNRIGHLSISFHKNKNTITGVVEDDGIGRLKAAEIKEQTGIEHASRGMQITGERVNVINYIRNMNIVIMTEDLKDESGKATGTKVTVNIPFAKN